MSLQQSSLNPALPKITLRTSAKLKHWATLHNGCVWLPFVVVPAPLTAFTGAMANASHRLLRQLGCHGPGVSGLGKVSNFNLQVWTYQPFCNVEGGGECLKAGHFFFHLDYLTVSLWISECNRTGTSLAESVGGETPAEKADLLRTNVNSMVSEATVPLSDQPYLLSTKECFWRWGEGRDVGGRREREGAILIICKSSYP